MRNFWRNLTFRQIILVASALLSLLIFLILLFVGNHITGKLASQQMAKRWAREGGATQVSCFFSKELSVTEDRIREFEHTLNRELLESSITSDSANAGARLWADAYSTSGRLTLVGKSGQMEVNAMGVGGDFFLFHPLQLIGGSYFAGSDLMQDHILLDEDAAWQLFGSNDVVGQQVLIDGVLHMVSGVIKRDVGRLNDQSGNGTSMVYVSYDTMSKHLTGLGMYSAINHYEVVLPNPVKGFGLEIVRRNMETEENLIEIVENTTRYRLLPVLNVLGDFGIRSMNGKGIIYPYWENVARGYEDILALLMIWELIFLLYTVIIFVIGIVFLWRNKTWNFTDVKKLALRVWELAEQKMREGNRKRKEEEMYYEKD